MNSQRRQTRQIHGSLKWFAVALSVVVVGLGMLAVRPDWHAALHAQTAGTVDQEQQPHSDQDAPGESGCAIAMFASGLIDCLPIGLAASEPGSVSSWSVGIHQIIFVSCIACLEHPGRSPPFAS